MNNIEQLPVGETFKVYDKKYIVVEDTDETNACWDCDLFDLITCNRTFLRRPLCMDRDDGKLVIFKELKNNKTKKGGKEMNKELRIETERLVRETERFCREEAESIRLKGETVNNFLRSPDGKIHESVQFDLLKLGVILLDVSESLREAEKLAKEIKLEGGQQ